MPKVKVPRKSTRIDMTAMCDVAFLLLTFFMLTSNFVAKEPIVVAVPSSISEIKIPETDIATVLIDKSGKVFFGLDAQQDRKELLDQIGKHIISALPKRNWRSSAKLIYRESPSSK